MYGPFVSVLLVPSLQSFTGRIRELPAGPQQKKGKRSYPLLLLLARKICQKETVSVCVCQTYTVFICIYHYFIMVGITRSKVFFGTCVGCSYQILSQFKIKDERLHAPTVDPFLHKSFQNQDSVAALKSKS